MQRAIVLLFAVTHLGNASFLRLSAPLSTTLDSISEDAWWQLASASRLAIRLSPESRGRSRVGVRPADISNTVSGRFATLLFYRSPASVYPVLYLHFFKNYDGADRVARRTKEELALACAANDPNIWPEALDIVRAAVRN
jgi:membrane protease YdiL (CAAX protease family)